MVTNQITPTLFALDKKGFEDKYDKLKFIPNLHIDFMDGKFTNKKSVNFDDICDVLKDADNDFGVHLMAYNPLEYLDYLKKINTNSVLMQVEVFDSDDDITSAINEVKKHEFKVGLVINPYTDLSKLLPFVSILDCVMFMGVVPGKEGQLLIKSVLDNVKILRDKYPDLNIMFDGGIKEDNIKEVLMSGVNCFSIGSAISGKSDVQGEYQRFVKLVTHL